MELLSNRAAATLLSELIPGRSEAGWATWLQNNRNKSRRVPYRIPFNTLSGEVRYERAEVIKFADWDRVRRTGAMTLTGRAAELMAAVGVGERGGSSTGRALSVTHLSPQVDHATGRMFLQLITEAPLMVYRLELEGARALANEILQGVAICERSRPDATAAVAVSEPRKANRMLTLTLQEAAEYLDSASIDRTVEADHAVISTGVRSNGVRFVMMNDCFGKTVVSESL